MGKLMLIVLLFAMIVNAKVDVRKLFNGQPVSLGHYDSFLSIGNLTNKYPVLHNNDLMASKNAGLLVEQLRRMFGVGIFPMPILEPYRSEKLEPLLIRSGIMTGIIKLNSIKIQGASRFNLKELEIRIDSGRVDYRMSFPTIDMKLHFQTDMKLSQLIPVILSGELSVHVVEPSVSGAFKVQTKQLEGFGNKHVYQVTGTTVHVNASNVEISFQKMKLENDLLQSLDSVSDNASMREWMQKLRDLLDIHFLNEAVTEINTIMRSLTTAQVNTYLYGGNINGIL